MRAWALALVASAFLVLPRVAQPQPVADLALVLAADISFSIDQAETEIQRQGYIAAFRSPELARAILQGPTGRIAVTYVEWSGPEIQRQIVPWRVLDSRDDALAFAAALEAAPKGSGDNTSISAGVMHALALLERAPVMPRRKVIDLSSDGINNAGPPLSAAKAQAEASGVTVNGLPILDASAMDLPIDMIAYFEDCVKAGPGAFVMPVQNWADFQTTLLRKLQLEIAGRMPERLYHAVAPTDCLIGEKLERDKYRQQLDSITDGKSERWQLPDGNAAPPD